MPGGYYIALSGMKTRLSALDRLASDIANASTAGYKVERASTQQADRPSFDRSLESAIDVATGNSRVDVRSGAVVPTGRPLDVSVDGSGFLVVDTPNGPRYTRSGRLMRRADGVLTTSEGDVLQDTSGKPIKVSDGPITIDEDGSVRSNDAISGTLKVVTFDSTASLEKETSSRFKSDVAPTPTPNPTLKSASLEQSNVSVVDSVTELTSVTRSFETLQRALSVLMNDVDGRAISELGRR
ncbi:MAG TPA: flagellar hook basal-body protein [Vicinamibacterales bacterium]|nr:flagellar hook basal-body protein [Vicinamibacterales bacterium]